MNRRKTPEQEQKPEREVDTFMRSVTKDMGEGVLVLGSTMPRFTHVPTGCFLLDFAQVGGIAEGCGHMVYGLENAAKTTLWLIVAASFHAKYPKGMVLWIDVDKKFDPQWAGKLGVDLDRIMVVKPHSGEKAVDVLEAGVRSRDVVCAVLDAIPSLAPMKILEKSAEDPTVSERARLVGLMCSKLQQAWIDEGLRGHKFTFLCINQWRYRVGVTWGDPRVLPGGCFQNYMVDTKLELRCKEVYADTPKGIQSHVLNEHVFKYSKTKGSFSIKQGEFTMVMDDSSRTDGLRTGQFDDYVTVATYAKMTGIITGAKDTWYIHGVDKGDVRMRFGSLDEIVKFFKDNHGEYIRVQRLMIIQQRIRSRLLDIPPDGYLLGAMSGTEIGKLRREIKELSLV